MTDQPQTADAREADDMGEKPDLGRTPDALIAALSGSDMGSDTRSGSLEGGAATGSDIDPDQQTVNDALASQGRAATPSQPAHADPEPVKNTGAHTGGSGQGSGPAEEADAATG